MLISHDYFLIQGDIDEQEQIAKAGLLAMLREG